MRNDDVAGDFSNISTGAHVLSNTKDQQIEVDPSDDKLREQNRSPTKPAVSALEPLPNKVQSIISKDPVRYDHSSVRLPRPEAQSDDIPPEHEEVDESARSLRPGQKGFAERLMSKYGWTKGTGLGASGSGIVDPLRVQLEKQKKKPDSEGGGFVRSGGTGKIIGGKKLGRPSAEAETSKFGKASEVIVLRGIIDTMDVEGNLMGAREGGLTQQIGDECSEKVCTSSLVHPKMY